MAKVNVSDFGAIADNGNTDNTTPFQNALNQCSAAGGGTVGVVGYGAGGRYGFSGGLAVPPGVSLAGDSEGPADTGAYGATLEVHNTSVPFIASQQSNNATNSTVSDLTFWYPYQTNGTTDPTPYPPTIQASSLIKVRRNFFINSYSAIVLNNAGRSVITDCNIGSFNVAVQVDGSYDVVRMDKVHVWPFYNTGGNNYPSEADKWTTQHGIGFNFLRADDVQLSNSYVFGKWVGMGLSDSPNAQPGGLRSSTGMATNVGFDANQWSVYASSTQGNGWNFSNLYCAMSAPAGVNGGKSAGAVAFIAGGSSEPIVQVNGGWVGGPNTGGIVFVQNNCAHYWRSVNWLGYQ